LPAAALFNFFDNLEETIYFFTHTAKEMENEGEKCKKKNISPFFVQVPSLTK